MRTLQRPESRGSRLRRNRRRVFTMVRMPSAFSGSRSNNSHARCKRTNGRDDGSPAVPGCGRWQRSSLHEIRTRHCRYRQAQARDSKRATLPVHVRAAASLPWRQREAALWPSRSYLGNPLRSPVSPGVELQMSCNCTWQFSEFGKRQAGVAPIRPAIGQRCLTQLCQSIADEFQAIMTVERYSGLTLWPIAAVIISRTRTRVPQASESAHLWKNGVAG